MVRVNPWTGKVHACRRLTGASASLPPKLPCLVARLVGHLQILTIPGCSTAGQRPVRIHSALHPPAGTNAMPRSAMQFDDPHLESLLPPVTIDRRSFIAAATAGFALAAGPVAAQSAIITPPDGLQTSDLKIPVDGGTMPGYMAAPMKPGRHATVMVVPEVFGMHEYQKDICRRLARAGYVGVTYDPFFRIGDLSRITQIKEVVQKANQLEDTQMLADVERIVAFVGAQPMVDAKRLGITGMCRGGRTVWMAIAHTTAFRAGVSWYGGLNANPPAMPKTPADVAGELNAPVLGLYGGDDAGIPLTAVIEVQEALKNGNRNSQASRFVLFPGMPHAFHADYRPSYRKEAAEQGWQLMMAWFREHGVA